MTRGSQRAIGRVLALCAFTFDTTSARAQTHAELLAEGAQGLAVSEGVAMTLKGDPASFTGQLWRSDGTKIGTERAGEVVDGPWGLPVQTASHVFAYAPPRMQPSALVVFQGARLVAEIPGSLDVPRAFGSLVAREPFGILIDGWGDSPLQYGAIVRVFGGDVHGEAINPDWCDAQGRGSGVRDYCEPGRVEASGGGLVLETSTCAGLGCPGGEWGGAHLARGIGRWRPGSFRRWAIAPEGIKTAGFPIGLGPKLLYADTHRALHVLWDLDEAISAAGLVDSLGAALEAGPRALFVGHDAQGQTIWSTDGTRDGTRLVGSLAGGVGQIVAGAQWFWIVTPAAAGAELWATQGVPGDLHRVTDDEGAPVTHVLALDHTTGDAIVAQLDGTPRRFGVTSEAPDRLRLVTPDVDFGADALVEPSAVGLFVVGTAQTSLGPKQGLWRIDGPAALHCPGTQEVEAQGPAGASVVLREPQRVGLGGAGPTSFVPPSGVFPIGTTAVAANVTSASGSYTCTFDVVVRDRTPPALQCPASVNVTTRARKGAQATFAVSASDAVGPVSLESRARSGMWFRLGTTNVKVTARDGAGNASHCQFPVHVRLTKRDPF